MDGSTDGWVCGSGEDDDRCATCAHLPITQRQLRASMSQLPKGFRENRGRKVFESSWHFVMTTMIMRMILSYLEAIATNKYLHERVRDKSRHSFFCLIDMRVTYLWWTTSNGRKLNFVLCYNDRGKNSTCGKKIMHRCIRKIFMFYLTVFSPRIIYFVTFS